MANIFNDLNKLSKITSVKAQQAEEAQRVLAGKAALQSAPNNVSYKDLVGFQAQQVQQSTTQNAEREASLRKQQAGLAQQQLQSQGLQMQQSLEQQRMQNEQIAQQRFAQQENARLDAAMASKKKISEQEATLKANLQALGQEYDEQIQFATLNQREQLNKLSNSLKKELVDSRLQFERDTMGRKFTTERQLADYALATSKTNQELNEKMAAINKAHKLGIQIAQQTAARLEGIVQRGWAEKQGDLNAESRIKVQRIIQELKSAAAKKEARARNSMAQWRAAGTVVGAVAGAFFGPAGSMAGAAAGAAIGGAVGTAVGSNQPRGPGQ